MAFLEVKFRRKKYHLSQGPFFKNDKCATVMSQDLFQQERKATKR
jgi:hypothetical protein